MPEPEVVLLGAYPPPIGGTSVHVARLYESLRHRNVPVRVIDLYSAAREDDSDAGVVRLGGHPLSRAMRLREIAGRIRPRTVVHFHVSAFRRAKWAAPWLLHLFRSQAKVVTIHSGSFVAETQGLAARLVKQILLRFDHVVAVSQEQQEHLLKLGLSPDFVSLIPAFIPSVIGAAQPSKASGGQRQQRRIVVTSGSLTPTYNHEQLADCIEKLRDGWKFVFCFYGARDESYAAALLSRLDRHHNVRVLHDQSPDEFLSILATSDAYIRMSHRDGDSVAVREALHLGKVVIASDCVARPDGCIVIHAADRCGLLKSLQQLSTEAPHSRTNTDSDCVHQLLNLYRSAVARRMWSLAN